MLDVSARNIKDFLDKSSFYNAVLACVILVSLSLDTIIAWYDLTFLATTYEDQIDILSFFFGLIGYLMGCAVVQYLLIDYIFSGIEFLAIAHLLSLLGYFYHWITLPIDEWNPVVYYLDEFYQYTYTVFPLVYFCHFFLALLGVKVALEHSYSSENQKHYLPVTVNKLDDEL